MAKELNDLVKDVLEAPSFGFVVTINESNQPVMTRIFGFKYDDPITTLTVYTYKEDAQHVIDQLSHDKKISVTTSNATNFNTIQFKGRYQSHYDVQEDEMHYTRESSVKQAKIMAAFGVPEGAFESWKKEPSVAIVINVDELYDQTPKINAGNKIS